MSYITNGLKTAIGAGSEVIAPGNPMGIGMAASGIGGLAGNAAGGSNGAAMSSDVGGALGMLGGGAAGGGGFAVPGTNGTPSMDSINSALANNPALSSLQNQVTGVSTATAPGPTNWLSMLGNGMGSAAQGMAAVPQSQGMQRRPAAPSFRGSGSGSPGFAQTISQGGMQPGVRPTITPPTFNAANSNSGPNYQLLRALGFSS